MKELVTKQQCWVLANVFRDRVAFAERVMRRLGRTHPEYKSWQKRCAHYLDMTYKWDYWIGPFPLHRMNHKEVSYAFECGRDYPTLMEQMDTEGYKND